MVEDGHEIASHGWRWISYQSIDEKTEREHIARAVEPIEKLTGQRPLGWYTGRDSPNTRRLVVEHGGFLYDADSYADDLPYWQQVHGRAHLVVPYTLDCNDMRFATLHGFATARRVLRATCATTFDVLYREGEQRAEDDVGRPALPARAAGRDAALRSSGFSITCSGTTSVWICRRVDIARHWIGAASVPGRRAAMSANTVDRRGQRDGSRRIRRALRRRLRAAHRGWREAAWESRPFADRGGARARDARRRARCRAKRASSSCCAAHPRLGTRRKLSGYSQREQAGAGLGAAAADERAELGAAQSPRTRTKFGFPFILAVRNASVRDILDSCRARIEHERRFGIRRKPATGFHDRALPSVRSGGRRRASSSNMPGSRHQQRHRRHPRPGRRAIPH